MSCGRFVSERKVRKVTGGVTLDCQPSLKRRRRSGEWLAHLLEENLAGYNQTNLGEKRQGLPSKDTD